MKLERLILLGLDSMDANLVSRWAAEGYLPNLARLIEAGATAHVATPPGVLEGAIWPTILTSSAAATHGMYAYKQLVLGTYDLEVAMMADRLPIPPFWAYISGAGRRVAVIDAPFARPVKKLNGIQVTNWGGHDLWSWQRCSWPKSLMDDLVQRFGDYPVPHCDAQDRTLRDYHELRLRLMDGIAKKTALLHHCMKLEDWDFFFGVYSESHCAGHQFWHFMDPSHPRHDPEGPLELRHCIRDIYSAIDAGVGQVIDGLMDRANVCILLSHGMGPYYHGSHLLEEVISRLAVNDSPLGGEHEMEFISPTATDRAKEMTWSTRRILPEGVRQKIKENLPEEWQRSLWRWGHPAPRPVNPWTSKRVFQLPESNMTGLLRINVEGREPNGLVKPGDEYEHLCGFLTESLLAIENAETGRKAVQWVARARDLYHGPRVDELPDLFIEWDHRSPIRSLRSPKIGTVEGSPFAQRTGSHWQGGQLIGWGPLFGRGSIGEIETVDLAPTLLDIFGVTAPAIYEGRTRLDALRGRMAEQAG